MRYDGLLHERGARPFHFEVTCLMHLDYNKVVIKAWREFIANLIQVLSKVKEESLMFNKDDYAHIFKRMREIEKKLK